MYNTAKFKENIRNEIKKRGLKESRFARDAGLCPGNMWRIFHDDKRGMTVESLVRILNALPGTTAEDLLK